MSESPLGRYHAHLARGELAFQFDPETDRPVFYPRVFAPGSGSGKLEWRVSTGRGTVYSTTINYPRDGAPYNVALIELEEGFRMMSRVEDIDPRSVKIGLKVRLKVHPASGDQAPLPVFVPEGGK